MLSTCSFRNQLLAFPSRSAVLLLALLLPVASFAQTPPDLTSTFETDIDGWTASDATATLNWSASGGTPGGCLQASRGGSTNLWYLRAPGTWAGDWSGYRVLKFDLSIPSRHYPDAERAGMVVIVDANGREMTWVASTPLWTWTHFEVDLSATAFSVDEDTFTGILTNVAELRILGEFTSATETIALDNVVLTATPPEAYAVNLESRFNDGTVQGWRPVDDVTLSVAIAGRPSFALYADDWQDGRWYKIASPTNWAGNWSGFVQLSFDMAWSSTTGPYPGVEVVRIFGANGNELHWTNDVSATGWKHHEIPLIPESFGTTQAEFDGVMNHVSEMWIFGEFGGGDDITQLDNIVLAAADGLAPKIHTQNLISRFDAGKEDWIIYDDKGGTLAWSNTFGFSGGGLRSVDTSSGTRHFQTPDAWAGDWRTFKTLRFMVRPEVSARNTYDVKVWIMTERGTNLLITLPRPYGSWTPYTLELTPETFGVDTNQYNDVMSNVACMWILAELASGSDVSRLDDVMLLTEDAQAGFPPDRTSDFAVDQQGWRYGEWVSSSGDWGFDGPAPRLATGGNPDGFLQNTDTGEWTYWFSPESWAGDWRGLQSCSFDFKIITGTAANLLGTRMLSICSAWTNLHADVVEIPVPGQWMHYEFSVSPSTFAVSPELFEKVMRDCVALCIRSEWINYSETEGLDNVRLTKATNAYWTWMAQWFSSSELADENITGRLADPDGDRADNWNEFIAGTTPTNRLDVLRIDYCIATNGMCWLGFNSRAGRFYDLETTTNLAQPPSWNALTNDVSGTGTLIGVLDTTAAAGRFYRLKVRN